MSVARHLQIPLDEYDARIRTFIPGYDEMLEAAARALLALPPLDAPVIVDLGTGTGALALRCMQIVPRGSLVGVDEDAGILDLARRRLEGAGVRASFQQGSFLEGAIPSADAVMASLALHHVRTIARKAELYRQIARALRRGGLFVTADCFPPSDPRLAKAADEAWRAHLLRSYSVKETDDFFAAWGAEDTYVPLDQELAMMRDAEMSPEAVWRLDPMGVIVARVD